MIVLLLKAPYEKVVSDDYKSFDEMLKDGVGRKYRIRTDPRKIITDSPEVDVLIEETHENNPTRNNRMARGKFKEFVVPYDAHASEVNILIEDLREIPWYKLNLPKLNGKPRSRAQYEILLE